MKIIDIDYVALALINYKKQTFDEEFISFAELNQFGQFMQNEFNNRNLDVAIKSLSNFNLKSFNIIGMIIKNKDDSNLTLNSLSMDILEVLTDNNLISNFFLKIEEDRINKIKKQKQLVLYK